MRFFQLPEIQSSIPQSGIYTIVLAWVGKVFSSLDIVAVGAIKQICLGQISKVSPDRLTIDFCLSYRHQGVRNFACIGERTNRRTKLICNQRKSFRKGYIVPLQNILQVGFTEQIRQVFFLFRRVILKGGHRKSAIGQILRKCIRFIPATEGIELRKG